MEIEKLKEIFTWVSDEEWNKLFILLNSNGEKFGVQEIRFVTEMGIPLVSFWEKRNQEYIQAYKEKNIYSDMPYAYPFQMIKHKDLILCLEEYIIYIDDLKKLN